MKLLSEKIYFYDIINEIYSLGHLYKIKDNHEPIITEFENQRERINKYYHSQIHKLDFDSEKLDHATQIQLIQERKKLKEQRIIDLKNLYKTGPLYDKYILEKTQALIKEKEDYIFKKCGILFDYRDCKAFHLGYSLPIEYNIKNNQPNFNTLSISFDFYPIKKRETYGIVESFKSPKTNTNNSQKSFNKYGTIYKEVYSSDFDFVVEKERLTTQWQQYILSLLPDILKVKYLINTNKFNQSHGLPLLNIEDSNPTQI